MKRSLMCTLATFMLSLVFSLIFSPISAFAQTITDIEIIDSSGNVYCITLSSSKKAVAKQKNSNTYQQLSANAIKKKKRKYKKIKKNKAKAAKKLNKKGKTAEAAAAQNASDTAKVNLSQLIACKKGQDLPPDGNGGGGGSELGQKACQIMGGSTSSALYSRIINGTECTWGDSPIVALNIGGSSRCTGSVFKIENNVAYVLTAAHCFIGFTHSPGSSTGSGSIVIPHPDGTFAASKLDVHPSYNSQVTPFETNDAAIVQFPAPIHTTRTIPLTSRASDYVGQNCYIGGFGLNGAVDGSAGDIDLTLRVGQATISGVTDTTVTFPFTSSTLNNGFSNTCSGDSGSGIFCCSDMDTFSTCRNLGPLSNGVQQACGVNDFSNYANAGNASVKSFIESICSSAYAD